MKVLHINCNYVGTKLHRTMIGHLRAAGGEHHVFAPTDGRTEWADFHPEEGEVVRACFRRFDRYLYFKKQWQIRRALEKAYDVAAYDFLQAYTVFTDGNCAMQLAKKYRKPFAVAVRSTDLNGFFRLRILLRRRGVRILRNASAVFFLSEAYERELLEKYIPARFHAEILAKSHILPNGIDPFWLANPAPEKKPEEVARVRSGEIRALYVGTLIDRKKAVETAKAIGLLRETGTDIRLTVVGRAVEARIAEKLRGFPYVSYFPACPKEELISYYRQSDIFVMPSKGETFGLVYAEAMTQRLPVIYGAGEGFDGQFAPGEVGFAADGDSPEDIAEKIRLVCASYEEISKRISDLAKKFDWKHITGEYYDIYSRILAERGRNG